MSLANKLRYWLPIIVAELPDYRNKLNQKNNDWVYVTNRKDKYVPAPDGFGLCLLGDFTSVLEAPRLFPVLSNRLFKKSLDNFKFEFVSTRLSAKKPKVSYIIGHRGKDRISHLNLVIQSIAAQSFDLIECIVVEQSEIPQIRDQLPDWITYYHVKVKDSDLYNRSLSFNYGAKKAKGDYLVLHDNDLVIPTNYTKSHLELLDLGFDIVNLKRFIFCLSEEDTGEMLANSGLSKQFIPEYILQNAKGGGSLVISKSAYEKIGGFDERFCGWGGEDNEIWQRAQILNIYPFASLPLIHLWHQPQLGKRKGQRGGGLHTESLLDELSEIPIYNRIKFLTTRP